MYCFAPTPSDVLFLVVWQCETKCVLAAELLVAPCRSTRGSRAPATWLAAAICTPNVASGIYWHSTKLLLLHKICINNIVNHLIYHVPDILIVKHRNRTNSWYKNWAHFIENKQWNYQKKISPIRNCVFAGRFKMSCRIWIYMFFI